MKNKALFANDFPNRLLPIIYQSPRRRERARFAGFLAAAEEASASPIDAGASSDAHRFAPFRAAPAARHELVDWWSTSGANLCWSGSEAEHGREQRRAASLCSTI